jgi:DNA-binding CsgD family transcriptional regulator
MTGALLERDRELAELDALLSEVTQGQGRIVLVSGEAGIGKTSLVERFLASARAQSQPLPRLLWGACEALYTPRPLGPLYDVAYQNASPLRELLEGAANRATLFAAVLDELAHTPTIFVIEDIHWADEATLDLLTYLARRIQRTATLLVLTYRDDEVDRRHPLRLMLGDLPTRQVTRLPLLPLSEAAVAALAHRADRSARDLFRVTAGNPFFLTEALASEVPGVPNSVSDAVLARVARRSEAAQQLLELVAVVPNRIESTVVAALGPEIGAALDECLTAGLLHLEGESVGFRHELARQAVEGALTPARRRACNGQVLRVLMDRSTVSASLARLTHHAAAAEDAALVLRFAPVAASQAAARGAHREAAVHYQTALRFVDALEREHRAVLLEGLSNELYLSGHHGEAKQPCEEALAIRRAQDQGERVGYNLRRLSRLTWLLGDAVGAERYGRAAVDALELLPPGRELAMAYGNMSHIRMLAADAVDTELWCERAIDLAERLGDVETLSYALNNQGAGRLDAGDESGWVHLQRSLEIALEHGLEEHVARAYFNLSTNRIGRRDYLGAMTYIEKGTAYCVEHDLGSWQNTLQGHQSRIHFAQGNWESAEADAAAILKVPWGDPTSRVPALLILGQLRARRGDPGAAAALDEARDLALAAGVLRAGTLESYLSVVIARAEWHWLRGHEDESVAEASAGMQRALNNSYPWHVGELAICLWRGGELSEAPAHAFPPFAQQIQGDWRGAAGAWERIGCPYERALALMDGDPPAQREALAIFERLGAAPAAEITRKRLRLAGARGLPRGPRPATRTNPLGLTPRQHEILLLLAEGLHNSEIAIRLSTTSKTVEHHVSAVMAKLQVRSRTEAVRRAYEAGLMSPSTTASPVTFDV